MLENNINTGLSTATAARKYKVSRDYLFEYLLSNKYLDKSDGKYTLTEKGYSIGGRYHKNESGQQWPVWPDESIVQIIGKCNWIVDISQSLELIRKKAYSRLESKDIDLDLLHAQLESGVKILDCEDCLDMYIRSYSYMHRAKLINAYAEFHMHENLRTIAQGNEIQIVDYACGQGIASIVFVEYLRSIRADYKINQLMLIEPSQMALERCNNNFTGNKKLINKKLDDLDFSDINTDESSVKFHLLSNILDMGDDHFSLQRLSKLIVNSQKGKNYFFCVSVREKNKLDRFMRHFNNYTEISSFNGELENKNNTLKPWKTIWNIFKVDL